MPKGIKVGWKRFNLVATVIGEVQGNVVALLFYFTVMAPFAIAARLFSDPLNRQGDAAWIDRDPIPNDIDSAKEQG